MLPLVAGKLVSKLGKKKKKPKKDKPQPEHRQDNTNIVIGIIGVIVLFGFIFYKRNLF